MNIFDPAVSAVSSPQPIPVIGESLAFVSDRAVKIARACTMIASVVPDTHAVLSHSVDYALSLVRHVHRCEQSPEQATIADVQKIAVLIRQLSQQWDICYTTQLVSDMNYHAVAGELGHMYQFVQEKLMTYCIGQVTYPFRIPGSDRGLAPAQQITISDFFETSGTDKKTPPVQPIPESKTEPVSSRTEPIQKTEKPPVRDMVRQSPPQTIASTFTKPTHEKSVLRQTMGAPVSGEDKKERRDAIMRTIRSLGQVTIKDISKNIRGCSEKTIQRDLQELIQHGVLIREGEKRWAVYKLAMKNV